MGELEEWIAAVRGETAGDWPRDATDRLSARLLDQPTPVALARRRERGALAGCLVAAALIGFLTTGAMEFRPDRAGPRWPAATDMEPSVLLVADSR
jgi:hypothetical protein